MSGETTGKQTIIAPRADQRSRMTNARLRGKVSARGLIGEGDGRGAWARRFKDAVAMIVDDLGGLSEIGEIQLSLVRRFAGLAVECERMESAMARGEPVDMQAYARLSDVSRRLAAEIGLKRITRPGAKLASLAERMRAEKT